MLALVGALCFILAFFGVTFGGHDLVPLGLFFLALEFVWRWPWYSRTRP